MGDRQRVGQARDAGAHDAGAGNRGGHRFLEAVPQPCDGRHVVARTGLRGRAEGGDRRQGFGAGAPSQFLAAATLDRGDLDAIGNHQRTRALQAAQLVSRKGHEIRAQIT